MNIAKDTTVLVTGATGAVGPCVVQALCEAGHTVSTFSLDRPHDGQQTTDGRRRTPLRDQATPERYAQARAATAGQAPDDGQEKRGNSQRMEDGPPCAKPLRQGRRLAWAKRSGGVWQTMNDGPAMLNPVSAM